MAKQTITAVIPAMNEEKNISRCLESVAWCDQTIVICMGSDQTAKIAEKMGAKAIIRNQKDEADFIALQDNINWIGEMAQTDWLLRLDADERVADDLKTEIQSLLDRRSSLPDGVVGFGIPRRQFFFGGFLKGGDWVYDRLVRLYKPKSARHDLKQAVHEQFVVDGKISTLKGHLEHFSHPDLDTAVRKFNLYTTLEARQMEEISWPVFSLFFQPIYVFFRWIIWHHGYRDGLRGIIAAVMRAWYEFIKYAKYLEKQSSARRP